MKKNFLIKSFILLLICLFGFCSISAQAKSSTISRILINPLEDNTYSLNIYFDKEYKGKSYIEKNNNGFYSIYLTNTELDLKDTKVLYKKNVDKRRIKISLTQKPLSTKGKLSNYVTLDIAMNADYTLQIVPKSNEEDKFLLATLPMRNSSPIFFAISALLIAFLLIRIFVLSKRNINNNSYTKFPDSFYTNSLNYNNNFKYNRKTINKYIKKNSKKKSIDTAKKASFRSFDVADKNNMVMNDSDFKTAMNKSYLQTNPIKKEELDIPYAEDVIENEDGKKHDKYGAEIISTINIDKNKSVYLANTDDFIGLFARINNNIFLLKRFKDLSQINLQARFYDNNAEGQIYIVRIDSYKAMVEFSKDSVRELVVL